MKKTLLLILISIFYFLLSLQRVDAALLYSGAANQTVYVGKTFVVNFYLDTQKDQINTMDLKLSFSKENLKVVSASTGDSNVNIWIKTPQFSNETGTIEMTGGIVGGIESTKVQLFTVTFEPIETGTARISMEANSSVLLSNGAGDPAKLTFAQIGFPINPANAQPAVIFSPTHPDESSWYKEGRAVIKFDPKPGEIYSYSISSNQEIIPDDTPDEIKDQYVYDKLADAVYYFKLNSKVGASTWQEAGIFRIQIDRTPPENLQSAIGSDPSLFSGKPFVSFSASDKQSGVSHYEVRFGNVGPWQKTSNTALVIPGLVLGQSIEVKVVDAAGNETIHKLPTSSIPNQSIFNKWYFWAIIIIAGILAYFATRWIKKTVEHYRIK